MAETFASFMNEPESSEEDTPRKNQTLPARHLSSHFGSNRLSKTTELIKNKSPTRLSLSQTSDDISLRSSSTLEDDETPRGFGYLQSPYAKPEAPKPTPATPEKIVKKDVHNSTQSHISMRLSSDDDTEGLIDSKNIEFHSNKKKKQKNKPSPPKLDDNRLNKILESRDSEDKKYFFQFHEQQTKDPIDYGNLNHSSNLYSVAPEKPAQSEQDVSKLKRELSELQVKYSNVSKEAEQAKSKYELEIQELKSENLKMKNQINSLNEEITSLTQKNKELTAQNNLNTKSLSDLSISNTKNQEEVMKLNAKIDELNTIIQLKDEELKKLEASKKEMEQKHIPITVATSVDEAKLRKLTQENTDLQKEVVDLRATYDSLAKQTDIWKNDLNELKNRLESAVKKNTSMEEDVKKLKEERDKLVEQNTMIQNENNKLKEEIAKFKEEESKYKDELKKLQDENTKLQGERDRLQAQFTILSEQTSKQFTYEDVAKGKISLVGISPEQLKKLEADIQQQERLLIATQEDNKRLHIELKKAQAMLKEQKELLKNKTIQQQPSTPTTPSEVENRLRHEVYDLEKQLNFVKQNAIEKEQELKALLHEMKEKNSELEKKLKSIANPITAAQLTKQIEALEQQLIDNECRYKEKIDNLFQKLQRHIENEELSNKNDQLLRRQDELLRQKDLEIKKLKDELTRNLSKPANQRIKQLEKKIQELERNKNTNKLPKTPKSGSPDSELIKLQKKCQILEEKLANAHEENEKMQNSKIEKLKSSYEQRIKQLEEELKRRNNETHNKSSEPNNIYLEKMQKLEAKIADLERASKLAQHDVTPKRETHDKEISTDKIPEENKLDQLAEVVDMIKQSKKLEEANAEIMKAKIQADAQIISLQKELQEAKHQLQVVEGVKENSNQLVKEAHEKVVKLQLELEQSKKKIEELIKEKESRIIDKNATETERQLKELANQLANLEAEYRIKEDQHRTKEKQLQQWLEDAEYKAEIEMKKAQRNFQRILEQKNLEVAKFKQQLQQIMIVLTNLKKRGIPVQANGTS